MAEKIQQPIIYADFSSGLYDDLAVAKSLMPKNSVSKAMNCVFDRPRGGISQRYGTTAVGAVVSAGSTILGLHNFRCSTTANSQLLASVGGSIYKYSSGTWSVTTTGFSSTEKTRFITYLDYVAVMDGVSACKCWSGTGAWVDTGGALAINSFPRGKYATTINTRIAVAGVTGALDTLYLSSLASAAGAISWTSGNKQIEVFPNDGGGNIAGLAGNGRVVLIFKERGLYRYDDSELQRIGFVGTTSNESIVTDDQGITYFFGQGANGVGFYMTNGGRPIKISRVVTKYVEAISASYYANIAGYTDGEKIEWAAGSITIGENTYSNASLVYSISDKTWSVFNRADSFRVFSQYINSSSEITTVGADTDGYAQTISSGNTDNGDPIHSEVEFAPIVFTTRGRTKVVTQIVTAAETYQGLILYVKTDDNRYSQIGSIDERNKHFNNLPILRGNEFTFKLTANNSGIPWEFSGFEFPDGSVIDESYRG